MSFIPHFFLQAEFVFHSSAEQPPHFIKPHTPWVSEVTNGMDEELQQQSRDGLNKYDTLVSFNDFVSRTHFLKTCHNIYQVKSVETHLCVDFA